MRQANDHTQTIIRNMLNEQRPWVSVGSPKIEPLVAGKLTRCEVQLKNIGKTPAQVTWHKMIDVKIENVKGAAPELIEQCLDEGIRQKRADTSPMVIAPDAIFFVHTLEIDDNGNPPSRLTKSLSTTSRLGTRYSP